MVDNVYTRAVKAPANPRAQALLAEVFAPEDAAWRGLGVIPGSGAGLREDYARFDARRRFADLLARVPKALPSACRCGDILRGLGSPGLPPIRPDLHPVPTPGTLHGLQRRRLRREHIGTRGNTLEGGGQGQRSPGPPQTPSPSPL